MSRVGGRFGGCSLIVRCFSVGRLEDKNPGPADDAFQHRIETVATGRGKRAG
jgi:hypothetical protein